VDALARADAGAGGTKFLALSTSATCSRAKRVERHPCARDAAADHHHVEEIGLRMRPSESSREITRRLRLVLAGGWRSGGDLVWPRVTEGRSGPGIL